MGERHFTMFSVFRNSIIQQKSCLNPRLVNRSVDGACGKPVKDVFDKEDPFLRLCSEQPAIAVEHVDVVRRPLAFGRWALPRLYRELHATDPIVQLQAINSVCDICHNPEKTFEAIRLKFIPRLGHLLMRATNEAFQERILIALKIIGSQALGRDEIISRRVLINGFKHLLGSQNKSVRCKTAAVIEMLSRSVSVIFVLIEEQYIPTLVQYIKTDDAEIVIFHLQTLEKLFTHATGQEEGIFYDALMKMVFLLESPNSTIVSMASNCLALLVSHPDGKKIAVEEQLLVKLTELLLNENREIYTSAAMVIMFATHLVRSKHQAAGIPDLAERLLHLCNDYKHPPAQMFAMKALGNMVEHPSVRKKIMKNHLDEVEAIRVCDLQELKDYKTILLKLVKWRPEIGYI